MGPSPTQQRVLVSLTAVLTFFAGIFVARGWTVLFFAALILLAIAWFVVAIFKIGEKPGR